MPRRLPSLEDAQAILARKRTRPMRRPPPMAGKALTPLLKSLDERFGKGVDGLKARWREIAGEMIAARTEPVKLVKGRPGQPGVLEIRVDGPAAALIQHQAPGILERVRLVLGEDAVGRLRIVQGPVRHKAPVQAKGVAAARARRRSGPLDAAEEARLQAELAKAPDGPLKQALLRLGREVARSQG
ncbi:MAG TPA: DciA family protein [Caulobacteraceae bacterium]|jgi:hypothetical protein|nr:DciA family protein [Caulobacteraceae bacterium]